MTRPVGRMSVIRQPMDVVAGNVASVRVLRVLLRHGGPLPVARLVRDARVSPNGVRDVLRLLERAGVVDALGEGRSRLYIARHENPLVASLEGLFTAEQQRFEQILESIRNAADEPQVVGTWLFGSVARGEDGLGSDVDIAVAIDSPEAAVPAIADAIRDRLAEHAKGLGFSPSVIALSPGDIVRLRNESAPLWSDLLRDALVVSGLAPREVGQSRHDEDRFFEESGAGLRAWPAEEGHGVPGFGEDGPARPKGYPRP